jgi:hypothetical protein
METELEVRAEPEVVVEPIAYVDAVLELKDWAHGEGIDYPNVSPERSELDSKGNWLLRDEYGVLIARVGYNKMGTIVVI